MQIGRWFRSTHSNSKPRSELQSALEVKDTQSSTAISDAKEKLGILASMHDKGLLLIGIESVAPTTYFAVAVSQQNIRQQQKFLEIEMYWLPFVDHQQCVAHMDICLHKKRNVELVDWYVKQPNQGYGSILMKHVLSFLRTIGYDYFWGSIQPRDFDHLELLLHFYRNFGFEITPRKKSYAIKLYLLPDSKSSEQSMAMSNACVGHGIGTGEAEIKLQPMLLNLTVGQKAIVTPEICLEHTPLDLMAFFSQNPKIAAVDNSGTIVAISPGTTDVIYQCGEIGAYCRVTVKDEILPIEHDPKQSDSQDRG